MSYRATYFVQDCPTCGRQLQVRVEYLGKKVKCQHCSAAFHAHPRDVQVTKESSDPLLQRADELLATAEELSHRHF